MPTEWTPSQDDASRTAAPAPWGRVPDGEDGGDGAGTGPGAGPGAGSLVDGDATNGEEELHRAAVDAVDGLLDEVEQALARLDDGSYGRCESCGEVIDDRRLAELPIVRTCGRCAEVDAASSAGPVEPATI